MITLLYNSPTLLVKFCLDPMTISLALEGWDWSLFTFITIINHNVGNLTILTVIYRRQYSNNLLY